VANSVAEHDENIIKIGVDNEIFNDCTSTNRDSLCNESRRNCARRSQACANEYYSNTTYVDLYIGLSVYRP
jgi:hypothetical protein